jgi:hypothetical protein
LSRDCLTRYVPPSGFGYPLGGLRPSVPCRLFFTPAALLGFTLRSFLLQKGTRAITARMSPLTVSPASDPDAGALGRPSRPRFLGFNPSRSPWRPVRGLARQPLDAPMGLALPGFTCESLGRTFARPPLTRFADPAITRLARRRPRVSIGFAWLLPTAPPMAVVRKRRPS